MDRVRPYGRARLRNLFALERLVARRVHRSSAQRIIAHDRIEQPVQLLQQFLVESSPDPPRVHERSIHQIRELESAQMRATALGLGEADDDEVARALRLDLEPIARPPAPVPRSGFLGDDSLEPHRRNLLEERFAFGLDVIEIAQSPELGHDLGQQLLSARERERTQIEILEREKIERIERRRQLHRRPPNLQLR